MKKTMYMVLLWGNAILFVMYRFKVLPIDVQVFIGNYGLHAMGMFSACLFFLSIIGMDAPEAEGIWAKIFKVIPLPLLFCLVFATGSSLDEIIGLFSTRPDWYDVLAHYIGALSAYLIGLFLFPLDKKTTPDGVSLFIFYEKTLLRGFHAICFLGIFFL